jgi:hypothetical protein
LKTQYFEDKLVPGSLTGWAVRPSCTTSGEGVPEEGMSVGQEWHYRRNGQQHGPISGAELKQLAAAGKLGPADPVWKEGMAKWVSARSLKGLFPAAPAPVATAAPPPPVEAASPVADGAGEVVEVIPAPAKPSLQERASGLFGKGKRLWQPLGTPAKLGIVGGAVGSAFLLLLLFCVLPLWWFFGGSSRVLSPGGASSGPGSQSTLTVPQMVADYARDEAAAEAKYRDKTLTVSGVISVPAHDMDNSIFLETRSQPQEKSSVSVIASFKAEDQEKVAGMGKGTSVVFKGLCRGLQTKKKNQIWFVNCELIPQASGSVGPKLSKADFLVKLHKASGTPAQVQECTFPTKAVFFQKMGQPQSTENLRDPNDVPFELVGKVPTEALTYECSDGRLRLEVGNYLQFIVLRAEELP